MTRRVLASLLLTAVAFAVFAQADEPAKPAVKPKDEAAARNEAVLQQQRLQQQYKQFEQALLNLAQRLERSNKPEDVARAKTLKDAIREASNVGINLKFEKLVETLKASRNLDIQDIREAMTQSEMLAQDIRAILALLLSDNRDQQIKDEKERLKRLLEMIDRVIRDQKQVRAQTEGGRVEKDKLVKSQTKVTDATKDVSKAMDKKGKDGKDSQGKPKDGQPKDGQPKDGQPKDGKPKDGQPKSGQPKDGQPKDGQPKDGQPKDGDNKPQDQQQPISGKKQVEDAIQDQKKAEKNLDQDKKNNASRNQDDAIRNLEEARKRLEESLRQLREEELERLLADLKRRCERMLQMQIAVLEDTVRIDKAINLNSDKKPTRPQEQDSLKLSDREEEIVREANRAIDILAAEGSAVAFAEVFLQVRDDMKDVSRRLGKVDVGHVTQQIEQDIIAMLREMIEALTRQIQQNRNNPPPPGGPPPPQTLLDLLAELKMIRSMQIQVNNRTTTYARQYQGEQAGQPDIVGELAGLARRQQKIFQVTNDIARGKNR